MSTFEEIFAENYKTKFRVAKRMVDDGDNVPDILQEINPSKMVFHDGSSYVLQPMKNTRDVPLRLVRFKRTN